MIKVWNYIEIQNNTVLNSVNITTPNNKLRKNGEIIQFSCYEYEIEADSELNYWLNKQFVFNY